MPAKNTMTSSLPDNENVPRSEHIASRHDERKTRNSHPQASPTKLKFVLNIPVRAGDVIQRLREVGLLPAPARWT